MAGLADRRVMGVRGASHVDLLLVGLPNPMLVNVLSRIGHRRRFVRGFNVSGATSSCARGRCAGVSFHRAPLQVFVRPSGALCHRFTNHKTSIGCHRATQIVPPQAVKCGRHRKPFNRRTAALFSDDSNFPVTPESEMASALNDGSATLAALVRRQLESIYIYPPKRLR